MENKPSKPYKQNGLLCIPYQHYNRKFLITMHIVSDDLKIVFYDKSQTDQYKIAQLSEEKKGDILYHIYETSVNDINLLDKTIGDKLGLQQQVSDLNQMSVEFQVTDAITLGFLVAEDIELLKNNAHSTAVNLWALAINNEFIFKNKQEKDSLKVKGLYLEKSSDKVIIDLQEKEDLSIWNDEGMKRFAIHRPYLLKQLNKHLIVDCDTTNKYINENKYLTYNKYCEYIKKKEKEDAEKAKADERKREKAEKKLLDEYCPKDTNKNNQKKKKKRKKKKTKTNKTQILNPQTINNSDEEQKISCSTVEQQNAEQKSNDLIIAEQNQPPQDDKNKKQKTKNNNLGVHHDVLEDHKINLHFSNISQKQKYGDDHVRSYRINSLLQQKKMGVSIGDNVLDRLFSVARNLQCFSTRGEINVFSFLEFMDYDLEFIKQQGLRDLFPFNLENFMKYRALWVKQLLLSKENKSLSDTEKESMLELRAKLLKDIKDTKIPQMLDLYDKCVGGNEYAGHMLIKHIDQKSSTNYR